MEYREPETYCPGELNSLSWADLQSLANTLYQSGRKLPATRPDSFCGQVKRKVARAGVNGAGYR